MASLSSRSLATLATGWRDATTGPAYGALADRIRLLVIDGRIPLGTRLPAERELAAQLQLSRTTVSAAYGQLRDTGYVDSLRGSGSVVRLPARAPDPGVTTTPEFLDLSKATMPGIPAVLGATERAAVLLPQYFGESGFDALGLDILRQGLADRYTRRGLPTSADEIMVTVGAQSAIAHVARTLLGRGDRVLVESPSYPHAFEALRAAGGRLVPVSVSTEDGWDELAMEQAIQRTSPTLAYLMPDFHNPTGRSMSPELRRRVIALAQRQGTTLVIDETMSGLGLDGQPEAPPFAIFGGPVITIGSVGKSVWGGLRIGWIRADREIIQRIARMRFTYDLGTPVLDQLIVADLLPDYEQILADRRIFLRENRDRLAALLADRLPAWRMPHVEGGLTAWVNLGTPVSSQLALAARSEGVVIAAGPRFGLDGVFERYLRIPFSHPIEDLERSVEALERAWAQISRHPVAVTGADLAQVV
ncbi:MocR-like transcription factor YczR [Homoserinibacter sp. YIM 151385]|uniref:MocR-like transcription factor YczR n=1 Tax=Homoserinibacter sp. YIM 151385 TaxID=2985506 RepID=UPI0022EFFAD0|nr:PLP-dependent aminotransferase family protein [Homoserinibacter sp. YIM 151385]WBU37407.1 PLP-dependent aminotransferase family protein [Homoserinibacter sp. YIM 151385]